MSVFDYYSYYYDLLYKDKNYKEETDYILSLMREHAPGASTLLDLGCGTGKHDLLLAENELEVVGVDLSATMIAEAKKNLANHGLPLALEFLQGDVRSLDLSRRFDVVTCLFHVINYQISNQDLSNTFDTVKKHLQPQGIFIFDSWYGPAVLSDKPTSRVRRIEDNKIAVVRVAEPELFYNDNIVDVNYSLIIKDKELNQVEEIREQHRMRYLFYPEVEMLAKTKGFEIVGFSKWLSRETPDLDWYVTFICRYTG